MQIGLPLGSARDMILVVAVCIYSKLVILHLVTDKLAVNLVWWFYNHIICKYGVPRWMRKNKGGEF